MWRIFARIVEVDIRKGVRLSREPVSDEDGKPRRFSQLLLCPEKDTESTCLTFSRCTSNTCMYRKSMFDF